MEKEGEGGRKRRKELLSTPTYVGKVKSHEDEAKEEKGEEEEVEVFARWPRPRGGEGGVGGKVGRGGGGLTTVFMHARRIFLFSFFCVRVRVVRRGEGRGRVPAYHTPRAKEEGGREGVCVTGRPPPPM